MIHVEPGSWSGADNGDPEFKKWFGDPNADGYSYDRNSWAVMTAAENIIRTAEADPTVPRDVVRGAKRFHLVSQTSCYEYWDGTEDWDTHPTRASNQTIRAVQPYLTRFMDRVGPSILIPQREPYNPGLYEWGQNPEPSDFEVWTYAFDLSGLEKVSLRYRIQKGKKFPQERGDFSMNAGTWNEMAMESRTFVSRTTEQPLYKANEFFGKIRGVTQSLVSYYVVAVDKYGNENRSELLHVYVGDAGASGPDLVVEPGTPSASDAITITSNRPGTLHWGVNSWTVPHAVYWPQGSVVWGDGKAVRTPLLPTADGRYAAKVGPFNRPEQAVREMNFIINYSNGAWGPKDTRIIIR